MQQTTFMSERPIITREVSVVTDKANYNIRKKLLQKHARPLIGLTFKAFGSLSALKSIN